MAMTLEELERIAGYACIGLTPQEREEYLKEINQLLDYYTQKLEEKDLGGVEPTFYINHMPFRQNFLREDKAQRGMPREKALEGAPMVKEGQFAVPRVL